MGEPDKVPECWLQPNPALTLEGNEPVDGKSVSLLLSACVVGDLKKRGECCGIAG